ncbi:MAG: hypothetical protein EHM46_01335, partial [Bacteroidetes bacterium]
MEPLIRKIRQIEKGDRKLTLCLILQGMLTGIFVAGLELVSSVLFLESHAAGRIPLAFMISGGLGILISTIFSYFSRQLGVRIFGLLNLSATGIMCLALLLLSGILPAGTFRFVLFVSSGPLVLITLMGFWSTFRNFLPPARVKQLSGLVELGLAGGMVLAFLAIPLLVTGGLALLPALALCTGCLVAAIPVHVQALRETRSGITYSGRKVQSTGPIGLISHRYTAMMAAFALVGVATVLVVQYAFLWVADSQFPGGGDLVVFLGSFYGGMAVLTFLLKKILFERLKKKFGTGTTLLLAPGALMLVTVASAIAGESWSFTGDTFLFAWFFLLVAAG